MTTELDEIIGELIFRAIVDCLLTTKRQKIRKCTRNKKTCGKTGCTYYNRSIFCCVGKYENERCSDCFISNICMKQYCERLKERYDVKEKEKGRRGRRGKAKEKS